MRRLFAAIVLTLLASPGVAGNVLVSVGNTAKAARLVLTFEHLPEWSFVQTGRALELTFEDGDFQVESSDGIEATSGRRIAGIRADAPDGKIVIALSCDCAADAYPFGSSSLVVEVRDALTPGPVATVLSAAPSQPPQPDVAASPQALAVVSDDTIVVPSASTLTEPASPAPAVPELSRALPWPVTSEGLGLAGTLGFSTRSGSESQAVEMLSRELSRAAAQGLVASGPEANTEHRRSPGGPTTPALVDRSNIKIVTSLDRAVSANLGEHPPTKDGRLCFSDSAVDLASWGDTSEISTIGSLRHNAYGENGAVTSDGARDLARYYIALGFGSEAAAAARFMEDGDEKQLLLALADIVDHGASNSPILDGQINCRGQIALWAALSRPIEDGTKPESVDVILATFSALAPHHRAHLGPVLAERMRAVGLEDAARNAVNAVARGGLQSNESELVTARLELGGTQPDKARGTLVEISNGTDVTAAEALLELLEDAERRGMAPNPVWVEDAPSLSRATEGNEVAPQLNLAGLRGRIALGQFDELRFALAEDTPGLDASSRNTLSVSAVSEAARHADDAEFLRAEVGFSKLLDIETMPRDARIEVARRLLRIGLATRARHYVSDNPQSESELETLVQVYSATGQLEQAVSVLDGRDDRNAALQLGTVFDQLGRNASAIEAFEEGGSLEEAAQSALRAGDWNWIAKHEIPGASGLLSNAARALVRLEKSEDPPAEAGEPGNGRLVEASRERRRHAESLLAETDLSSGTLPFTN